MEKFVALKEAEDLEYNLQQIIRATRGEAGLKQFMALRNEEKKAMELEDYETRKRSAKIKNVLSILFGSVIFLAGLAGLVYVACLYGSPK